MSASLAESETVLLGATPPTAADPMELEDRVTSAEICRRTLRDYIPASWHIIEPGREFVGGWHVDAICEHLQAVIDGQIKRLIINIPPRCSKSTIISVDFPTWAWIGNPRLRFLISSYALELAVRDAVKSRRLIQSHWYQERFGHLFKLEKDQNVKSRYENNHRGYRISTSVGAATTGEGGDVLICFPADEPVWMGDRHVPIGDVVKNKIAGRIPSLNTRTGRMEQRPITGWHENPGSKLLRIVFSDGAEVRCTPLHEFWTFNCGMVRACDLRPWHMLPDFSFSNRRYQSFVDTVLPGQTAPALGGVQNGDNLSHRQLSRTVDPVGISTMAGGYIRPGEAIPNLLNCSAFDAILGRDHDGLLCAFCDPQRERFCQNCTGTLFVNRECSVSFGVVDVLRAGSVTQIRQDIVRAIPVSVANLLAGGAGADEREHDALMNSAILAASVEPQIPLRVGGQLQNPFRRDVGSRVTASNCRAPFAPDLPGVGDGIPIESGYRFPVFAHDGGFAEKTYCLTVEDNHTFCVGVDNIIVANCDDPHSTIDAFSDAERAACINWWKEAMSNRHNDSKGASIIIGQRVHVSDLSAELIGQGGWEVLSIPMEFDPNRRCTTGIGFTDPRTEDGQLMQPERFTAEDMAQRKREMGTVAFSGQYNQNPVPRGGSFFLMNHFSTWTTQGDYYRLRSWHNPETVKVVHKANCIRFATADTASTLKTHADNSAIGVWDLSLSTFDLILLHVHLERMEIPQVRKILEKLAVIWKLHYLAIEYAAAGIGVVQDLRMAKGLSVKALHPVSQIEREHGAKATLSDKVARASIAQIRMESGQIYFPEDAPDWLGPLTSELLAFSPAMTHAHDDQVDMLSYAAIEAHNRSLAGGGQMSGGQTPLPEAY